MTEISKWVEAGCEPFEISDFGYWCLFEIMGL